MDKITNLLNDPKAVYLKALQLMLLIQTYAMFSMTIKFSSSFKTTLWRDIGLASDVSKMIDKVAISIVFALAVIGILYTKRWIFAVVGCWTAFLAANTYYQGGSFGAPYTLFAYAVRMALPFSLVYWFSTRATQNSHNTLQKILAIGIGVTFITHGIEALNLNPKFVDFLIRVFRNYFSIEINQPLAEAMLLPIGVIDIIVGCFVIFKLNRYVLIYMAFWGILTACVRWLFSPQFGFDAMLVRVGNGCVPLLLLYGMSVSYTKSTNSEEDQSSKQAI